ncbi:chemotaxis protein CheW [Undibacterium arcticum]
MTTAGHTNIDDCWNRVGIRGNGSCPELRQHVHCRNCPTYSAAAAVLLDRILPDDDSGTWNGGAATIHRTVTADTESALIFRIGEEWLALPSYVIKEVAELRKIHSLPHQRNQAMLGITNIRGALLMCVSLTQMLGLDDAVDARQTQNRLLSQRLLVLSHQGHCVVFPVAEVYGIHRFPVADLKAAPMTVARATATYTRAIVAWRDKTVGLLDAELLFYTLNRSFS